jgi:16S rRNA U516 pseudouridylate synthase RsuA-like enzyme
MTSWGGARSGAGRKPKDPDARRRALSVTVSEGVWHQVRAIAEARAMPVSELVDAMLGAALALPASSLDQPLVLERIVPQATDSDSRRALSHEDTRHPGGG